MAASSPVHVIGACLVGSVGGDVQGVNIGLHEGIQRAIDELMALQNTQTLEVIGHDAHSKVPAAVARARVARMQMAVIDEIDPVGMQGTLQCVADACGPIPGFARSAHDWDSLARDPPG